MEAQAGLTLMNKLSSEGDLRDNHILDSNVARGALIKGRCSWRALRPVLCKAAAVQVAAGLLQHCRRAYPQQANASPWSKVASR